MTDSTPLYSSGVPDLGYVVEEARRLVAELVVVPVGQLLNLYQCSHGKIKPVKYGLNSITESSIFMQVLINWIRSCMEKVNVNKM